MGQGICNIICYNTFIWMNDYCILVVVVRCALFDCYGCVLFDCNGYAYNFLFLLFLFGKVEQILWKQFSQQEILASWHENPMMSRIYVGI